MGERRTWALAALLLAAATPAGAQGYPATPLLATGTTVVGEPIAYPTAGPALVTSVLVTLAPGESTVLHRHGVPMFAYVLEGELTVDYGAHGTRTWTAGQALMEAMAVAHAGTNTGVVPVRILAVYMGSAGSANVIPAQ